MGYIKHAFGRVAAVAAVLCAFPGDMFEIGKVQSVEDGVLAVDMSGHVLFANRRFEQMWHVTPDTMEAGDDDELLRFVMNQLTDSEGFLAKVRKLYHSFTDDFDILHFRDGPVFERHLRAFVKGNKLVGRIWCFHDITKLTHAEKR